MSTHSLRMARQQKRMTLQEVADALGVSRQSVWAWEHGKSVPSGEHAVALSRLLDLSVDAILSVDAARGTARPLALRQNPAAYAPGMVKETEMVKVPFFGGVGAGNPVVPAEAGDMVLVSHETYISDFGEAPLLRDGRWYPHPVFGYFQIEGDSAAPVYFDGERLPVRLMDDGELTNDLLYVFRWDGMLLLKRLRRLPRGFVEATSLNPSVEPFRFHPGEDPEAFRLIALARASHKQQLYAALVGRFLRADP